MLGGGPPLFEWYALHFAIDPLLDFIGIALYHSSFRCRSLSALRATVDLKCQEIVRAVQYRCGHNLCIPCHMYSVVTAVRPGKRLPDCSDVVAHGELYCDRPTTCLSHAHANGGFCHPFFWKNFSCTCMMHAMHNMPSGMRVHAHACMHVGCINDCTHTCLHACMHGNARMLKCEYSFMRTCVHACGCTCVHAYMLACLHACIFTCMHAH